MPSHRPKLPPMTDIMVTGSNPIEMVSLLLTLKIFQLGCLVLIKFNLYTLYILVNKTHVYTRVVIHAFDQMSVIKKCCQALELGGI